MHAKERLGALSCRGRAGIELGVKMKDALTESFKTTNDTPEGDSLYHLSCSSFTSNVLLVRYAWTTTNGFLVFPLNSFTLMTLNFISKEMRGAKKQGSLLVDEEDIEGRETLATGQFNSLIKLIWR